MPTNRFPFIILLIAALISPLGAAARKKKKPAYKIESLTLPTTFVSSVKPVPAATDGYMTQFAAMATDSLMLPALRHAIDNSWAGVTRYTPESYLAELREIALAYPEITSLLTIGTTVENRPIATLRLGSGPHTLYVMASLHGREWLGTTHVMKSIEHLLRGYNAGVEYEGFDCRQILDSCTIYISPMFNPDGVDISQRGAEGRDADFRQIPVAKTKVGYPSWKANGRGVDLNRNFSSGWNNNTSSPQSPNSEQYKGPAPESEPETRAFISFTDSIRPEAVVSFHTQGEILYMSQPDSRARRICSAVADVTGYEPQPIGKAYGSMQDDVDTRLGCIYINVELCPSIGPTPYPHNLFFKRVWSRAAAVIPTVAAGL